MNAKMKHPEVMQAMELIKANWWQFANVLVHQQFTVKVDIQITDGVSGFDDDGTDVKAHVELFEVGKLQFGVKPDKLCLILV